MALFDIAGIPRWHHRLPPGNFPDEIVSLSGPVNTLLKSSYLLGATFEIEAIFNSLFDIAEEIAGVEACGFLSCEGADSASWRSAYSRRIDAIQASPTLLSFQIAPGAISSHFDKPVPWIRLGSLVQAHLRSLVFPVPGGVPLHRDRDIAGAVVFGKREFTSFTPVQVKLLWALSPPGRRPTCIG